MTVKKWFVDKMTDELKDFEEVRIVVPYELKDVLKEKYSLRWYPDVKSWITNRKIAQDIENNE